MTSESISEVNIFENGKPFYGNIYKTTNNWMNDIPLDEFKNRPIQYLEIGIHSGANLIHCAHTYGAHKDSILHAIDPWENSDIHPEFKNEYLATHENFKKNIQTYEVEHKLKIYQDFSQKVLLTFDDNFFDIIYIDGNHSLSAALEDGIFSRRKLKVGGYLIFDDIDMPSVQEAVNIFMFVYYPQFDFITRVNHQLILRKKSD